LLSGNDGVIAAAARGKSGDAGEMVALLMSIWVHLSCCSGN
jgi:hypothetical protein